MRQLQGPEPRAGPRGLHLLKTWGGLGVQGPGARAQGPQGLGARAPERLGLTLKSLLVGDSEGVGVS